MPKRVTLSEFIAKSKLKHEDKYDYSKVKFDKCNEKVIITCPIHGDFLQTPSCHLRGQGCKHCVDDSLKLTTSEFIDRAKLKHGNKYDYSKVVYINNHTNVLITCPIHGESLQMPDHHLNGHGCYNCARKAIGESKRLTIEKFIEKAKKVHGDKYDYSKIEYVNYSTRVIIICKQHGDFEQRPGDHLRGEGCYNCGKKTDGEKTRYTTEEFIEAVKLVHNNKYDYSKLIYTGIKDDITIICPIHGEFEQRAGNHLQNQGCIKCGIIITANKCRKSTEEFVEAAKKIHGDRYDYSKTNYIGCFNNVTIICKKHGEFKQSPDNHLHGKGCKKCFLQSTISKGELEWLEYMGVKEENCQIKISNYWVDALKNGVVYEFLGDYYHGNPEKFNPYDRNEINGKLFCELYMSTFNRFDKLKRLGYNIKYIWESDWNKFKNNTSQLNIMTY